MSLLITSKADAIQFAKDRIDLQADTIEVDANANGTYAGPPTCGGPPSQSPPDNSAAKSEVEAAINGDAAKVSVTKQGDGKYVVVSA